MEAEEQYLNSKLAWKLLNAKEKVSMYDSKIWEEVMKILDLQEDFSNCPFEDITYDPYDTSFEFKKCEEGFILTQEQQYKFWEMGFIRCWLCYKEPRYLDDKFTLNPNYKEIYYYDTDWKKRHGF